METAIAQAGRRSQFRPCHRQSLPPRHEISKVSAGQVTEAMHDGPASSIIHKLVIPIRRSRLVVFRPPITLQLSTSIMPLDHCWTASALLSTAGRVQITHRCLWGCAPDLPSMREVYAHDQHLFHCTDLSLLIEPGV